MSSLVARHVVSKRNGDDIVFFTDWDYSDDSKTEAILKQAMSGDCGDFLMSSAEWAMNVWTSGNQTGALWALKVASDVRAHIRSRITLRATYAMFAGDPEVFCTEVSVSDDTILRLTWDKSRDWVWVKRLLPIKGANGKLETVTFGAIWDDGIYRQLSRNSLYEDEVQALKVFNMRPKQQWVDKRGYARVDCKKVEGEENERLMFPTIEEAERYERNRRRTEYLANQSVNESYAHPVEEQHDV